MSIDMAARIGLGIAEDWLAILLDCHCDKVDAKPVRATMDPDAEREVSALERQIAYIKDALTPSPAQPAKGE